MKKAAVSLFTGVLVFLISIVFVGIFTYFAIQYFGGIEDIQKIKANRNNLAKINETINELRKLEVGSYKVIELYSAEQINFEKESVNIEQKVKNIKSIERMKKEINIASLKIEKREDILYFSLGYEDSVEFQDNFYVSTDYDKIKLEIVNKEIVGKNEKIKLKITRE